MFRFPTPESLNARLTQIRQLKASDYESCNASNETLRYGERAEVHGEQNYTVFRYANADCHIIIDEQNPLYYKSHNEGHIQGNLVIHASREQRWLKSIVLPKVVGLQRNDAEIEKAKTQYTTEVQTAYRHDAAPYDFIMLTEDTSTVTISILLKYSGYPATFLQYHRHFSEWSPLQYLDCAIQIILEAIRVYKKGDVHRDIKLANYVVATSKRNQPIVSLIDYEHTARLLHHTENQPNCFISTEAPPTDIAGLPNKYRATGRPDYIRPSEFRLGPATDIFAAITATEDLLQNTDPNTLNVTEREYFTEYRQIIGQYKANINDQEGTRSGHPTLSKPRITALEPMLSTLREEIIEHQLMESMKQHEQMNTRAYNDAYSHYSLIALKKKLNRLCGQHRNLNLQNLLDRIQKNINDINQNDIRPYLYEIFELLESYHMKDEQDDLQQWYLDIASLSHRGDSKFSAQEVARAAAAIAWIYEDYLQHHHIARELNIFSSLVFNNYEDAEKIFRMHPKSAMALYFYFTKNRTTIESYYTQSERSYLSRHKAVFKHIFSQQTYESDEISVISRIFNNTLIDEILIPYKMLDFVDNLPSFAKQKERASGNLYIVQLEINCYFLDIIEEYFFKDSDFFDSLLSNSHGLPKSFNQERLYQFVENIKLYLSTCSIYQSLLTHNKSIHPEQSFIISTFLLGFQNNFFNDYLASSCRDANDNAITTLRKAREKMRLTIARGTTPGSFEKEKQAVYANILTSYNIIYSYRAPLEALATEETAINAAIRSIFPSYKKEGQELSFEEQQISFGLAGGQSAWDTLFSYSKSQLIQYRASAYFTWVRIFLSQYCSLPFSDFNIIDPKYTLDRKLPIVVPAQNAAFYLAYPFGRLKYRILTYVERLLLTDRERMAKILRVEKLLYPSLVIDNHAARSPSYRSMGDYVRFFMNSQIYQNIGNIQSLGQIIYLETLSYLIENRFPHCTLEEMVFLLHALKGEGITSEHMETSISYALDPHALKMINDMLPACIIALQEKHQAQTPRYTRKKALEQQSLLNALLALNSQRISSAALSDSEIETSAERENRHFSTLIKRISCIHDDLMTTRSYLEAINAACKTSEKIHGNVVYIIAMYQLLKQQRLLPKLACHLLCYMSLYITNAISPSSYQSQFTQIYDAMDNAWSYVFGLKKYTECLQKNHVKKGISNIYAASAKIENLTGNTGEYMLSIYHAVLTISTRDYLKIRLLSPMRKWLYNHKMPYRGYHYESFLTRNLPCVYSSFREEYQKFENMRRAQYEPLYGGFYNFKKPLVAIRSEEDKESESINTEESIVYKSTTFFYNRTAQVTSIVGIYPDNPPQPGDFRKSN